MPKLTVVSAAADRSTVAVIDAPSAKPLFFVLQDAGVPVASACGGKAQCGLCRITVVEGWDALSTPVPVEEHHLGNLMHLGRMRLSCQTRMNGDAAVEIPRFESKEDRMRRKANARRITAERADAVHARGREGGRSR